MKSWSFNGTAIVFFAATVAVLTHCKDPAPSSRSMPSSGDANGTRCLTNPLALTNSSWNDGIGKIFLDNCGGCHPGSQQTNYTTYAGVTGNPGNIAAKIQNGTMPPNKTMSATDKSAIAAWVLAGAPEGTATATTTPVPTVDPNSGTYPNSSPSIPSSSSDCYGTSPTVDPYSGIASPVPSSGLGYPTPSPTF